MEKLTPIEIENKEFKRALFGYSAKSVNLFIEEIINSYEEIYRENLALTDKVHTLNEAVIHYKTIEDTLKNTLIMAEKTTEDIVETAREKAKQIEDEANLNARTIVDEANVKIRRLNVKHEQLIARYDSTRAKMYEYLKTQLELTNSDDKEIMLHEVI